MITVGATTTTAMFNASITELKNRFNRLNTEPLEDNAYVFNRFMSKNKTLIDVMDAGEMSIDQYHELQKHKMEALKRQLDKQLQKDIDEENKKLLEKNGIKIEEPKPEPEKKVELINTDFVPNWKKED